MEKQSTLSPANVLTLKVSRSSAGTKYPWDKVYLFKSSDYDTVKRAFPYSIIFRVNQDLLRQLGEVSVNKLKLRSKGRTEFESKFDFRPETYTGQNGESNVPLKDTVRRNQPKNAWEAASLVTEPSLQGLAKLAQDLCNDVSQFWSAKTKEEQNEILGRGDWCQLIPMLPKFYSYQASKKSQLRPLYITNKEWVARKDRADQRARGYRWVDRPVPNGTTHKTIPEDAVLIVNGNEEVTPPCAACANLLNHVQGDCELGGRACYEGMNFGKKSYFKRGLALQEMLKTMTLVEAYTKYQEEFLFYEKSGDTPEEKGA